MSNYFAWSDPIPHSPQSSTFEYDFAIPKESTPTIAGGFILSCRWLLRATLDRKLAFDVNEETAITVLSLAPGLADGPGEHGTSDMPEFAQISLSLPSREWVLGEAVQGRLLVRPQKDFDVSEVRVELAHTEYVPRDEGHKRVGWREVQVADKSHFRAGVTQVYPFNGQLDPDDPITSHTDHGSITWSLRGVLARPWAFDPHVQEEIFVYSGRKGVYGRQSV